MREPWEIIRECIDKIGVNNQLLDAARLLREKTREQLYQDIHSWSIDSIDFKVSEIRKSYETSISQLNKLHEFYQRKYNTWNILMLAEKMLRTRQEFSLFYKSLSSTPLLMYILQRNIWRYGDPMGRSFHELRKQYSLWDIIASSQRHNHDIQHFLSGFKERVLQSSDEHDNFLWIDKNLWIPYLIALLKNHKDVDVSNIGYDLYKKVQYKTAIIAWKR